MFVATASTINDIPGPPATASRINNTHLGADDATDPDEALAVN